LACAFFSLGEHRVVLTACRSESLAKKRALRTASQASKEA